MNSYNPHSVFSAPSFYLPQDITKPVILVGPGTGIAPFRGFWQHRYTQLIAKKKLGKMWLFFGCRQKEMDLYREEKSDMIEKNVLDKVFLALSREPNVPKVTTFGLVYGIYNFLFLLDVCAKSGSF